MVIRRRKLGNQTKEALIREDPRSAELLKPLVRGRDVHAYRVDWAGLWLIATFPAAGVNIDDYPAIRRYLAAFGRCLHQTGEKLPGGGRARKKTSHAWWELQDSCAYHEKFRQPKIMWGELANDGRFAVDRLGMYCNNTVFLMTADTIHWLCAVLNSPVARGWTAWTARTSGMGVTRWEKGYVESLPVPRRPGLEPTCEALIQERSKTIPEAEERGHGNSSNRLHLLVRTEYGLTEAENRLLLGSIGQE